MPALLLGLAGLQAPPAAAQNLGLVVRDGTVGSAPEGVVAPGPDDLGTANYLIRADLGEQRSGNLFHSFKFFSIGSGERATFTADGAPNPGAIENVISRVTGGDPSQIDGVLHSTIPGAALWLLNPRGVVFGAGAKLEVPGSFHVATADYLGFDGGLERFYADPTLPSVLATARPAAFGFLPETIAAAPLELNGTSLSVSDGETLELVGGDLKLTGATLSAPAGSISLRGGQIVIEQDSHVLAENVDSPTEGRITVATSGSLLVDDSLLSVNTSGSGDAGTIDIASPDVTFRNGPRVATNFDLDAPHATVVGASAETSSSGAGGTIDVDARSLTLSDGAWLSAASFGLAASGTAGTIRINADLGDPPADVVDVSRGAAIRTNAWLSPGNAGNVDVKAGSLVLHEGGFIRTSVSFRMPGSAGDVAVDADQIVIGSVDNGPARWEYSIVGRTGPGDRVGSGIYASALGAGTAGSVAIVASQSIILDDFGGEAFDFGRVLDQASLPTSISATTAYGVGGDITLRAPAITVTRGAHVTSSNVGGTDAGDIRLTGDRILIEGGGLVDSSAALRGGAAGDVSLDATEWIKVVGQHDEFGYASTVSSSTLTTGPGGAVTLRAPLIVVDGGVILTGAVPLVLPFPTDPRVGAGGDITLEGVDGAPARQILVQGGGRVFASTLGPNVGGQILAVASELIRVEGLESSIESRAGADGAGGGVTLRAPRIEIASGGEVSARSASFVDERGEPDFDARLFGRLLPYLKKPPRTATGNAGNVTLAARDLVHLDAGTITTAVGVARGGDIEIDPDFVILEHGSRITSEATELTGQGGHIGITTDNLFLFPGSVISAQGRTPELSGTVEIHSPDVNVAGTLASLPSAFLDASSLMRERCAARRGGERAGSFAVRGAGGIPAEPDGWLPAPVLAAATEIAAGPIAPPALVASLPVSYLAKGACQ